MVKKPAWDLPRVKNYISSNLDDLFVDIKLGDKVYGNHSEHLVEIIVHEIIHGGVIGQANIVQPPEESAGEISNGDMVFISHEKLSGTTKT